MATPAVAAAAVVATDDTSATVATFAAAAAAATTTLIGTAAGAATPSSHCPCGTPPAYTSKGTLMSHIGRQPRTQPTCMSTSMLLCSSPSGRMTLSTCSLLPPLVSASVHLGVWGEPGVSGVCSVMWPATPPAAVAAAEQACRTCMRSWTCDAPAQHHCNLLLCVQGRCQCGSRWLIGATTAATL